MKCTFSFIFIFWLQFVTAQNLTGTWMGYGGGTDFIMLVVTHKGDSLFGYTYDEGNGYCKATFQGRYDKIKKRLTGEGVKMLDHTPNHVLMEYDLHFESFQQTDYLREKQDWPFFERGSPLTLKRVSRKIERPKQPVKKIESVKTEVPGSKNTIKQPIIQKREPASKKARQGSPVTGTSAPVSPEVTRADIKSLPVTPSPSVVKIIRPGNTIHQSRNSNLAGSIITSSDSLTLILYDNGEVDGDTVSVFFNDHLILDRHKISERGKRIILPLSIGLNTIEMFAHNLGSIPPNTALLVINAGTERHELRASADLKTNARIEIRRLD